MRYRAIVAIGALLWTGAAAANEYVYTPTVKITHGWHIRVLDLEPRLRCQECDARGKAVVSIKWAAG